MFRSCRGSRRGGGGVGNLRQGICGRKHLLHNGTGIGTVARKVRNLIAGFRHDSPPPISLMNAVRNHLDAAFCDRWIDSGGGPVARPPRSPDLAALCFFLRGSLNSLIYETPVETEEDVVARILAPWEATQICQRFSRGCARTWRVAAVIAMKPAGATWDSSYELTENKTIKSNAQNVQCINIYEKNEIKKALIPEASASRLLPS
jgi:hypothetical protein